MLRPEEQLSEEDRTVTVAGDFQFPYPKDGLFKIGGVIMDLENDGQLSKTVEEAREKRLRPLGPKVEGVPTM
jgi:hypothetical protein